MSKKRKLHHLTGTIKGCYPGQVSSKSQWKGQPLYVLEIISESLFHSSEKETIYAFPNLVSKEVWKVLEERSFERKRYVFVCEKRVRGWRLKGMEEVSNYQEYEIPS